MMINIMLPYSVITRCFLPDDDCTVINGKITDRGQSFECDEGFENTKTFLYQRYSCYCDSGVFSCAMGPAECHPSKCFL